MTLIVCTIAAGVGVVGLARPALDSGTTAAAPAATTIPDPGPYGGGGTEAVVAPAATPAAQAAPAAPAAITIQDFAFGGSSTAAAGSALTVTNNDGAPHTLTDRAGAFDTGSIGGGGTATVTLPAAPGTYEFFCSIHPSMTGTITVQS